MKKQMVKGKTHDEKFKSIEAYLQWFGKRLNKYVVGAIPPIPVFDYVAEPDPETGIVLRRMFPSAGRIPKGVMYIEDYVDKGDLTVNIRIDNDHGGADTKLTTRKKMLVITPNMPIQAGDRLIVSVDPPGLVKCLWISFLYEVDFASVVKQQLLLDELLALMESHEGEPVEAEVVE